MLKCRSLQLLRSVCFAQILEEKQQLSFHLQQQRLIELIRQGKTEDALEFAQEYLAPRGEENPAFLEELGEILIIKDRTFIMTEQALTPFQACN